MKIKPEQLAAHLRETLLPLYFVHGDEPLLVQEACDAIRAAARAAGCAEREVHFAEPGFDWNAFAEAGDALSLFSQRKLIELRLPPSGKPGDAGARALVRCAEGLSPDNVVLIEAGKLDGKARQAKWYKALEKAGAVVQVWPVEARQLPGWAMRRMKARGLAASSEAVALLVERVEGNLLACAQEIEKLLLLHGPGRITLEQVAAGVADSARFDIYGLVDRALEGEAARILRVVRALRAEGVEPVLVLWALAREIRQLARMAAEIEAGAPLAATLSRHRVWEKRKPLVRAALQRHGAASWRSLLHRCHAIDATIKGARPGNPWDELLDLALAVGGVAVVGAGEV